MKIDEQFTESVLNSLSAHVAILNQDGVILETNEAWKNFAQFNNIRMRPDTIGLNYLEICNYALDAPAEGAAEASQGINSLINGKIDEFVIEYPCHSPHEKRWFYMKATRLAGSGPLRIVISHENITDLKKTARDLNTREHELKQEKQSLKEVNTALKVLLKRMEEDRYEIEEKVTSNIKELVLPYLEKLKSETLPSQQQIFIDIIESNLNNIISPFLKKITSDFFSFTPREIQVSVLVRDGRTTKEIAEILYISRGTINFHRKSIRKKLGINNSRVNLRTHLLSLNI